MGRRIIVYPQGPAARDQREQCEALTHYCGGDLQRVFERVGGSLAAFLEYALRLRVMHDRREDALVVLTRTEPLTLLLPARRALEQALPTLAHAVWAIYWDPARDPDLLERAADMGKLEGTAEEGPIWTAANSMSFLVLSPHVSEPVELSKRVGSMLERSHRRSGVQRLEKQSNDDVAREA